MDSQGSPQGFAKAPSLPFLSQFRKQRHNNEGQHVGQQTAVQNFFEAADFDPAKPEWVEYAPPSLPKAKREKHEGAALQTYRRRRQNVTPNGSSFYFSKIRLQSPYLREALEEILKPHRVNWKEDRFADSFHPHRGLYFAFDRIAELAQSGDPRTSSHCELLCTVLEEVFEENHEKLKALSARNMITYPLLWTLFPEGLILAYVKDKHTPRAYRVERVWGRQNPEQLMLHLESIMFDGWRYGTTKHTGTIPFFEGEVPVSDIPGFSFVDLGQNKELRSRLLHRGKKALDLQSIHYLGYHDSIRGEQRVMIDPHLHRRRIHIPDLKGLPYYQKINRGFTEQLEENHEMGTNGKTVTESPAGQDDGEAKSREKFRRPTPTELEDNRRAVLESDDNLILLHAAVAGYCITTQLWRFFDVDFLYPVERDEGVLGCLVMDEVKKDTVKTLVENHVTPGVIYDDLIGGKGQCLLVILSGPPGTGKTLLVESLAEHLGCPLLRADTRYFRTDRIGDILGYRATLGEFLKDATEWGALVLFDEPDFLFQSQKMGTDRKDLLAFLRHAEYFKGIIFLTTNITDKIDSAVISRAQIHLTFTSLSEPSRIRVWDNFNKRLPGDVGSLSAEEICELAKWQINGREIKNILNMAVSFCRGKKCRLSLEVVERLLNAIRSATKTPESPAETDKPGDHGMKRSDTEDLLLLGL